VPPAAPLPCPCFPPAVPCLPCSLPIPSRQGRHGSLPCLPKVGIGVQLALLVRANLSPPGAETSRRAPEYQLRKATHQRPFLAVSWAS
jgi:hypothetical protein